MVCPREHRLADVNAGKDFLTSLVELEIKVAAHDVASGDKISEAVRVATIMDHAPDAVKSMFRLSPLEHRRNVDELKLWIREIKLRHAWAHPMVGPDASQCCQWWRQRQEGQEQYDPRQTQGQGQRARTRASTRAVTTRARNETVGTVVNNKYNSKVIAQIAHSGDTNAQIVGLGWHNRRMVQWLVFRNRSPRPMVSSPRNGVMSTAMLWNLIRGVGVLQQ